MAIPNTEEDPIITIVYSPDSWSTSILGACMGYYKLWAVYSKEEVYLSERDTYENLWPYKTCKITKGCGKIFVLPRDEKYCTIELKRMK